MSDERSDLDWAREIGAAGQVIRDLNRYLRRRRRRRISTAAALLAVLAASGWEWRSARFHADSAAAIAAAQPSDARVVAPERRQLEDGSTVALRAGAQIAVDFRPEVRRVNLLGGEGLFQVAKNPRRPFLVAAAGVEVRAVGTAFTVQVEPQGVEVVVTEGRVAVKRSGAGQPAFVSAGERLLMPASSAAPAPAVARVSSAELQQDLEWTVPRLRLDGTALAETVALFNRYGGARIELADPSIGQLRLSGMLRADDREALLNLLQGEFHLTAEAQDGRVIVRRP